MSQETPDLPALVPFVEGPEVVEAARNHVGEYNLQRVPPERVEQIARSLAAGVPIIRICKELRCSPSTVYAVQRLRPMVVEKEKDRLGREFMFASDMARGAFLELVAEGKVQARDLLLAAGIYFDKAMLAMGQPGAIVEHKKASGDAKDLAAKLAKVIDVEEVKP